MGCVLSGYLVSSCGLEVVVPVKKGRRTIRFPKGYVAPGTQDANAEEQEANQDNPAGRQGEAEGQQSPELSASELGLSAGSLIGDTGLLGVAKDLVPKGGSSTPPRRNEVLSELIKRYPQPRTSMRAMFRSNYEQVARLVDADEVREHFEELEQSSVTTSDGCSVISKDRQFYPDQLTGMHQLLDLAELSSLGSFAEGLFGEEWTQEESEIFSGFLVEVGLTARGESRLTEDGKLEGWFRLVYRKSLSQLEQEDGDLHGRSLEFKLFQENPEEGHHLMQLFAFAGPSMDTPALRLAIQRKRSQRGGSMLSLEVTQADLKSWQEGMVLPEFSTERMRVRVQLNQPDILAQTYQVSATIWQAQRQTFVWQGQLERPLPEWSFDEVSWSEESLDAIEEGADLSELSGELAEPTFTPEPWRLCPAA